MANAHKDSENKSLPPLRGRLFEKLLRRNVLKNVLRAHTLSKTTRNVKSSDVGLQLRGSTAELHHDQSNHADSSDPPLEAVTDPRNHLNRMKECRYCGEPSRRAVM